MSHASTPAPQPRQHLRPRGRDSGTLRQYVDDHPRGQGSLSIVLARSAERAKGSTATPVTDSEEHQVSKPGRRSLPGARRQLYALGTDDVVVPQMTPLLRPQPSANGSSRDCWRRSSGAAPGASRAEGRNVSDLVTPEFRSSETEGPVPLVRAHDAKSSLAGHFGVVHSRGVGLGRQGRDGATPSITAPHLVPRRPRVGQQPGDPQSVSGLLQESSWLGRSATGPFRVPTRH